MKFFSEILKMKFLIIELVSKITQSAKLISIFYFIFYHNELNFLQSKSYIEFFFTFININNKLIIYNLRNSKRNPLKTKLPQCTYIGPVFIYSVYSATSKLSIIKHTFPSILSFFLSLKCISLVKKTDLLHFSYLSFFLSSAIPFQG